MSVKKYLGLALIMSALLALTGCGEKFPALTQEEYDQTVEYAVGLLMKYSNNGKSKLTYVDPVIAQEIIEQQKQEQEEEMKDAFADIGPRAFDTSDEGSSSSSEDENASNEGYSDGESEASEGKSGSDDGTEGSSGDENKKSSGDEQYASESGEGGSEQGSGGDSDAVVMSDDESREIMDDIFLSYQGYSISKTYPESSKSYVVNSDKGKRLLVLRFDLYNASDNAKSVNMLKLNLLFQIVLNGKNLGYTSVTFLPNDLSSYIGTIDSRAHESLVVLTQIDEKNTTNVETLELIVTKDGKDTKVLLR